MTIKGYMKSKIMKTMRAKVSLPQKCRTQLLSNSRFQGRILVLSHLVWTVALKNLTHSSELGWFSFLFFTWKRRQFDLNVSYFTWWIQLFFITQQYTTFVTWINMNQLQIFFIIINILRSCYIYITTGYSYNRLFKGNHMKPYEN